MIHFSVEGNFWGPNYLSKFSKVLTFPSIMSCNPQPNHPLMHRSCDLLFITTILFCWMDSKLTFSYNSTTFKYRGNFFWLPHIINLIRKQVLASQKFHCGTHNSFIPEKGCLSQFLNKTFPLMQYNLPYHFKNQLLQLNHLHLWKQLNFLNFDNKSSWKMFLNFKNCIKQFYPVFWGHVHMTQCSFKYF